LIEKIGDVEKIYMYTSNTFKEEELNYPSCHKEIMVVKLSIARFKLYLKPIKLIVKIDLKHKLDMLRHEK